MRLLKSFGGFWYDFIIGDDWKISAGVVVALGASALLVSRDVVSDSVLAIVASLLLIVAFAISLIVDVHRE
jgi:hypothetical protein